MRFCAAMIKKVLRQTGSNATVECGQNEFESSMGFVTVEGSSVVVTDMEGFSRAAEFADNTEIFPLKADRVRMTFTFHGLLKPIA